MPKPRSAPTSRSTALPAPSPLPRPASKPAAAPKAVEPRLAPLPRKAGGDLCRRIEPGKRFRLKDIGTEPSAGWTKEGAEAALDPLLEKLAELQEEFFIDGRRSLLVVLQGMDTSGKDGAVKKVFSRLNPAGISVTSFKAPNDFEASHDYLWRIHQAVPQKGRIAIFNRSHYEDVLITRVHRLIDEKEAKRRIAQINDFERMLTENQVLVLKFFLHISKDEQKRRLIARAENPKKRWKFQMGDLKERKLWDRYQEYYEEALSACSTAAAPWHAVPADKKWFRNLAIAQVVVETLEKLHLRYPEPEIDFANIIVD